MINSFLMFFAKVSNSIVKPESSISLIKTFDKGRWFVLSFNFRLMDMATFNPSFDNQRPLDWFKM
jgi:hypothetical protein